MLIAKVKASQTLAMLQKVREMKARGEDVISFAAGEPDFSTPEPVVAATERSLRRGVHYYVATPGMQVLRQAVAKDYRERLGVSWVREENVLITAGAKQGIFLGFAGALSPGDEVLIPKPYWVSYPDVAEAASGKPVLIDCKKENGFFPTPEELDRAYTPRSRALVLSSPGNPSGTMISREQLLAIRDWCKAKKVYFFYDELYERLVLGDKKHISVLALGSEADAEWSLSINAVSKSMAMTGWRVGYIVSHEKNIAALSPLQGQMLTCIPGFIQEGVAEGFSLFDQFLPGFVAAYKRRMKLMLDGLDQIQGLSYVKPDGAFYVFIDATNLIKKLGLSSDKELVAMLLEKEKLVCVGASSMGAPGWIRFSFATSDEDIVKGLDRLKRFAG